jgi:hypothetical protein
MQNKLEKASVLQHCCPEFALVKERQRAAWIAAYTKASTELTSKRLNRFCAIETQYTLLRIGRYRPTNNRS